MFPPEIWVVGEIKNKRGFQFAVAAICILGRLWRSFWQENIGRHWQIVSEVTELKLTVRWTVWETKKEGEREEELDEKREIFNHILSLLSWYLEIWQYVFFSRFSILITCIFYCSSNCISSLTKCFFFAFNQTSFKELPIPSIDKCDCDCRFIEKKLCDCWIGCQWNIKSCITLGLVITSLENLLGKFLERDWCL